MPMAVAAMAEMRNAPNGLLQAGPPFNQ